ncbi:MAG: hypothetical protein EKK54_05010 [Neisseriaceae bacterium]|nr:MAG: hypothetical protein EKK54_05010 [Neisseriaceae bacterium]
MNFSKVIFLSVSLVTLMTACSTTGLGQVPKTRENYNKAIDTSENEQFLLNIVRMHYGNSPYFVGVDSVTTQSTLRTKLEAQMFTDRNAVMAGPFWNIAPTIEFTEAPTITYTPLQGTKYVSGMMTPLTLDRIGMLQSSGWDLPTVLKLSINRIGVLNNSEVSRHVVDGGSSDNPEFSNFVDQLTRLGQKGAITHSLTSYRDHPAILLQTTPEAGAQISNMLHLKHNYTQFIFSQYAVNLPGTPENIVYMQTRSLLGILNYLANYIPDDDSSQQKQTKGSFYALVSNSEPADAVVKINYKGKWYYIANDDTTSKSILILLKVIYSLQLGDIKANLPMVVIPVGR